MGSSAARPAPVRGLAVALALLAPGVVAAHQLVEVHDPAGCPARLVPTPGLLRVHLYVETEEQRAALDPSGLVAYLSERTGRPFEVASVRVADERSFRLAVAATPLTRDIHVFLADRAAFAAVDAAQGMVNALGFATPGTACAYAVFRPAQGTSCTLAGQEVRVYRGYGYVAHEVGHLLGLGHAASGLMGPSGPAPCGGRDQFSPDERAALAAWGSIGLPRLA